MLFIRSLIFNIAFPAWTAFVSIFFSPLIFANYKRSIIVGKIWAHGTVFILKFICGITHEIRGKENLPKGPFIAASKHQSAWDTAIFLAILDRPVYILKKELLSLPFFGAFLKSMEMLPIDRSGGGKALKEMLREVQDRVTKNRPIIIFPEGTRTSPGEKLPYQPGIAFIYKDIDLPVIPVALNSGTHWDKRSFIKKPGKIILQYLPAIEPGLNRKEFLSTLESAVENGSESLRKESENLG